MVRSIKICDEIKRSIFALWHENGRERSNIRFMKVMSYTWEEEPLDVKFVGTQAEDEMKKLEGTVYFLTYCKKILTLHNLMPMHEYVQNVIRYHIVFKIDSYICTPIENIS